MNHPDRGSPGGSPLVSVDELPSHSPSWAKRAVIEFSEELGRPRSTFPCTFGIQNYRQRTLRVVFVDGCADRSLQVLADGLVEYLRICRTLGQTTSLLACFNVDETTVTVNQHRSWFWAVLQFLHDHDPEPWPSQYPIDPAEEQWAFCFGGEAYFIVCSTPAHELRRSRRTLIPMITFTPRWAFAGLDGHTATGVAVRRKIRSRVRRYDKIAPSPYLSAYGHGLDWVQYFLGDANDLDQDRCPLVLRR